MKRHVAPILAMMMFALLLIGGYRLAKPYLEKREMRKTSDASSTQEIRMAGDNYFGYFFITSPLMRRHAPRAGISINWHDDGGNYEERIRLLADGAYDILVLPVDRYLAYGVGKNSEGRDYEWPGVILAAVSESRDADGMVALSSLQINEVNDLNDPTLQFVYIPNSPNEFLLDLTATRFGLDRLAADSTWRVPVSSPEDVVKKAKANEGDVFIAWEPTLSELLEIPGMEQVWGSGQFRGYIVDVFLVNRRFLKDHEDRVIKFFQTYDRVMGLYANQPQTLVQDMAKATGMEEAAVQTMMRKVEWFDLRENCEQQFGIQVAGSTQTPVDGVVNTIIECTNVLASVGKLSGKALSDMQADPYLITNRSVLEKLNASMPSSVLAQSGGQAMDFEPLDDAGWKTMRTVGTMQTEPVIFQLGSDQLDLAGKIVLDKVGGWLVNNFPDKRVVVRGHTGKGSNETANVERSLRRAEVVKRYLETVHTVDPDRLKPEGLGSAEPPAKKQGESRREYDIRQSRVEFILVEPNPF